VILEEKEIAKNHEKLMFERNYGMSEDRIYWKNTVVSVKDKKAEEESRSACSQKRL